MYKRQDFTTQSMDYKDVGVKLKITPRISDDGSLRLEVEQEVSRVTQGLITLTNGCLLYTSSPLWTPSLPSRAAR